MPISGLVLTLDVGDPGDTRSAALEATLAALARDPRVTLGPREHHRLAIALETDSQAADKQAWRELLALPAVTWIDLAYITIDPTEAETHNGSPLSRSTS